MRMVGYGRVSTDHEEQRDSLEHQQAFFQDFARVRGHTLVRVYADQGISGKWLKKRDGFLQMLRDAERGEFELVVVKDISRFARNTVDSLESIRRLKALGIECIFVNNSLKVLGESEFIVTIMAAIAQEESANLSKRVKFGKDITSRKGRVPPRIYGYDRLDNFTLRIVPAEAEVVREIFRLYLQGLGCRKIAQALEERGASTKLGASWNSRGVRRVLENPIYCGHYVNHKYTVSDFLSGQIQRLPPDMHYHHDRPEWAIVSPDTFQEAARLMEQRRRKSGSAPPNTAAATPSPPSSAARAAAAPSPAAGWPTPPGGSMSTGTAPSTASMLAAAAATAPSSRRRGCWTSSGPGWPPRSPPPPRWRRRYASGWTPAPPGLRRTLPPLSGAVWTSWRASVPAIWSSTPAICSPWRNCAGGCGSWRSGAPASGRIWSG